MSSFFKQILNFLTFRSSCTIDFLTREGILPEKDEMKDIDRKVEKEIYE